MKIHLSYSQNVMGELDVDYYVPVTIRFNKNDQRPRDLLLYRIVNSEFSLIEFSINSSNKKLVKICVVSINSFRNKQIIDSFPQNIKKDNPDFDISMFNNSNIITEDSEFEISVCENEITVLLSIKGVINNIVEMDHVMFLLDEQSRLVGLKFFDFSKEQWETIKDSLKIH